MTAIQTGKDTTDKVIWALVCFFCGGLGGLVFFIVKRQGLVPLLMMVVGGILCAVGGGFNYSFSR